MYILIRQCENADVIYDYYLKPLFFNTLEEAKEAEKQFINYCTDYPCAGNTYIAKII